MIFFASQATAAPSTDSRRSSGRRRAQAAALIAGLALFSGSLTSCAPTPGNGDPANSGTSTTASALPAQGPVAACTDGTAGKLGLPADWQLTDQGNAADESTGAPGAESSVRQGAVTVNTDGITLPVVSDTPQPALPTTVTSCDGVEVSITDASRIVTIDLHGTLTEIVYGLGLGDNVVGRDRAADFEQAKNATIVTPTGHDLNAEAITALNPSLILTDTTIGPLEVQEQLRAIGIPVVFFDSARTMSGISHQITAVAGALGIPAAGVELNKLVGTDMVAALRMIPADSTPERIAFLYVRGTAGVYLMAGPGSGADDMIKSVGAVDVGTDIGLKLPFTQLTSEALIKAEPDVLLLMTGGLQSVGGVEGLVKIQGIAQTPAGASKRIIDVADGTLLSFGPRSGQIIKALAQAVHGVQP